MKNILVHYEDNALVIASTKNLVSTTYFECTIKKVPYRALGVNLRRWPPIWKFLLGWQGNIFPNKSEKNNCFLGNDVSKNRLYILVRNPL